MVTTTFPLVRSRDRILVPSFFGLASAQNKNDRSGSGPWISPGELRWAVEWNVGVREGKGASDPKKKWL